MLTKTDFSQIDKIVGARIKRELTDYPAKADLARELKPIKDDIAHIRKDIKVIISFFDHEYLFWGAQLETARKYTAMIS